MCLIKQSVGLWILETYVCYLAGIMEKNVCSVILSSSQCYTVHGLELSRVTLVNSSLQVVYDTFVRPDNEVIDYNTR